MGDLDPVDVREPDVEQDDLRTQAGGLGHALEPRRGLADHLEAVRFEHRPGRRAVAGVIVDGG